MTGPVFRRLLVANRGEIAVRILRTAKALGIHTIAIYSDADAEALHVRMADEAHRVGGSAPKDSYLNIDAVLSVARATQAEAIHPGYGFLSENPEFAARVRGEGQVFVGPSEAVLRKVGGKLEARALAEAAGLPIIRGSGPLVDLAAAEAAAEAIGYPVILKAQAGGGGIGMVVVEKASDLSRAFEDTRKKGQLFFSDPTVYLERYVEAPRHIEVQIFGDQQGRVVALGTRDCTVQRRHQKMLEEAPAARLEEGMAREATEGAVRLGKSVGYFGAGTVEMVMAGRGPDVGRCFFLEVNARLQVEHAVTEMCTGLDLVAEQLRVAAGESLSEAALSAQLRGHALEVRICAEDPDRRFFPSPGTVSGIRFPSPSPHLRIDSSVVDGSVVPPYYDSLLAKLVVHGPTRSDAIHQMQDALTETEIIGVKTNLSMLRRVVSDPDFIENGHDTGFLENVLGYRMR
jgi:acetyl/propionyl-CoA carboxylase alpha subunit